MLRRVGFAELQDAFSGVVLQHNEHPELVRL